MPGDWTRRFEERGGVARRQLQLRRELRAAIGDFRPDVALSVIPQSDVACAGVAPRLGLTWVPMVHGKPFPATGEASNVRRTAWKLAMRRSYRRADGLVAISHAVAADLERDLGLSGAEVIHTGVLRAAPSERSFRSEPVVGFVGRLATEKGADVFLEVAGRLQCESRIYGDGPLREEVAEAAVRNERLTYRGWLERNLAFDEIDLLLLPSRREGLGLVILEAGLRSICVIARAVGGIPEILGQDERLARHCLVDPAASPEQIRQQVEPVVADAALREDLGARLNRVVSERFDATRQFELLAAFLDECNGQSPEGNTRDPRLLVTDAADRQTLASEP